MYIHSKNVQAIAVTLGTAYDQWCLSQIARILGKNKEADYYYKCATITVTYIIARQAFPSQRSKGEMDNPI